MSITVQKVQCRGCGKFFVSNTLFDYHRVGNYGKRERHCLSTEEMQAAGLTTEKRQVRMLLEGKEYFEEHDVWYSPAARIRVSQAFSKQDEEEQQ
jgi:hypothetical protein